MITLPFKERPFGKAALYSIGRAPIAQILITKDDFSHEDRHQNFINTLEKLLEFNVLPIINENDTVSTEEIGIGDNDTLAAIVAESIRADKLILLSDIDGLYTADPHTNPNATLIHKATVVDDAIFALAGGSGKLGTGGMVTKLLAAKICLACGCDMVIMNGSTPALLYDLFDGASVGTRFYAKKVKA